MHIPGITGAHATHHRKPQYPLLRKCLNRPSQLTVLRNAALLLTCGLVSSFSVSSALSQTPTPPDPFTAESIRQEERSRALKEQLEPRPDVRLDRGQAPETLGLLPKQEHPCFPIHRITLTGEASDTFQWAINAASIDGDTPLDRCLGTEGINLVMKRIQNAIVARGYVTTRVLATPQDLTTGTLALTLIPGRIRQIRFAEPVTSRGNLWNAVPARPGDLLNLRDIEQALENLKRVPTAEADFQIVPAEGKDAVPGESDLVIQWQQATPLRLSVNVDDSGIKATGKNQGSFTVSLDHPLTLNDLFYLTWNQDLGGSSPGKRGTHGYAAHYSLPYDYWLLAFNASESTYDQSVAGIGQNYRYRGQSSNSDIKLSRLVYRDATRKTTLSLKGWLKTANNFIDDTEVLVQRRRMAGWEAGFSEHESWGDVTADLNLNYRRGTGALGSRPAPEEALGEGTARPRYFTADAQWRSPFALFGTALRYIGAWRAQWDRTPLVPLDRFSIGGRYTVRGFDGENTLSAERGWLLRNEVELPLGQSRQALYVGLDHGEVAGPSARNLVGKRLTGAVIGWRGALKDCSYDFFVGQPVTKPDRFVTASTTTGFSLNWAL